VVDLVVCTPPHSQSVGTAIASASLNLAPRQITMRAPGYERTRPKPPAAGRVWFALLLRPRSGTSLDSAVILCPQIVVRMASVLESD
jgi:hypothetical protein